MAAAEVLDDWLTARCATRPVALIVDDLQWADPATLDVLMWLLAGLVKRPLAVLTTLRRGEVGLDHPLQRWLADVRRLPGFDHLALRPLDLEETRLQVSTLVGGEPHYALVRQVFERTGGNAYLNRLLVAGLPANAVDLGDHALPEDLSAAVLRRWHELSPGARKLSRVIAVGARVACGRDLEYAAELAGVDDPGPLLGECLDAEVLDPQPLEGYWFHHPLQAEALEASLLTTELRDLHAAFAVLLESDLEGRAPDLTTAMLLADHHHRAGDASAAFRWALRAADIAEEAEAHSEVVRLLRRALRGTPDVDGAVVGETDLLLRLRSAAEHAGHVDAELEAVEALLDRGDVDQLTTAELIVRRQHLRFATGLGFFNRSELEHAARLACEADSHSWQHAYSVAECAHVALWAHDPGAHDLAETSLRLARDSGEPRALAYALAANAMCAVFEDRLDDAVSLGAEGVEAAALARDGYGMAHAASWESNALGTRASAAARAALAGRRRQMAQLNLPHPNQAWLATTEARVALDSGDWRECGELLREALGRNPGVVNDVAARLTAAHLAAVQGRAREAEGHLARADELSSETSTLLPVQFDACRATVRMAAGDSRGAVAAALVGANLPGAPPINCEWLIPLAARGLADLAEAARDGGNDAAEVLSEVDQLERRFPCVIRGSGSGGDYESVVTGLDNLYRSELARARGDQDRAVRWAKAAETLGRLPWEECYARWRLAEALFHAGSSHRSAAVAALRRSHALAVQLDARPDLDQILPLARSARVPLGEPVVDNASHAPSTTGVRLTAREEEVLAHIVAGRTYGEIARALVLSEKTVSSHVSHLLAKTATPNRVDLARWAVRRATPS